MSDTEAAPEFKYGVSDLAAALGLEPSSVRIFLRQQGVERTGRSYGWNTKAEIDGLVKKFQTRKGEATPKAEVAKATKKASKKAAQAKAA